ncbi:MAG TPA: hypothetical protein VFB22_07315 [Candidatus Baltobacteraceae bacterium]|nr:hypothetical protein [Candidatus Baltobacteraceae bacterium]
MKHAARLAAAAVLLLAVPLPGASATIPGLRASGTIVVQADIEGAPMTLGGRVALYHRAPLYRLDVLSLAVPGAGSELSAVASQLIAPGGVSFVYDAATGTLTAWSNANRAYYTATPDRRTSFALPPPDAARRAAAGDPLAALANVAAALRDVQNATIQLTGHANVNGHPATELDVQMRRQIPGHAAENYHAQVALADDLGDFPLQLTFQSTPASRGDVGGTMKLDLTTVQRDVPADDVFEAPEGYTRVSSLSGVLRVPR